MAKQAEKQTITRASAPQKRRMREVQPDPEFPSLPFIARKYNPRSGGSRVFWSVRSTGDYAKECNVGSEYAIAMIEYLAGGGSHSILHFTLVDIAEIGEFNGIVAGFFSKLSQLLAAFCRGNHRVASIMRDHLEAWKQREIAMAAEDATVTKRKGEKPRATRQR